VETIAGFPFTGIEFTKDGAVANAAQVADALSMLDTEQPSDVLVLSHGWNNDMKDARDLYVDLLQHLRSSLDAGRVPGARDFAVVGVFWPSKKFADADLIPGGGAAGLGSPAADGLLIHQLEDLKGTFSADGADAALEQAKQLVPQLNDSPRAREQFADLLRSVAPPSATDHEDATVQFFALPGEQLMQQLSKPVLPPVPTAPGGGGAARLGTPHPPGGGAAGLGSVLSGFKRSAQNLLNFTTYYQMKQRAGVVGTTGVFPVLQQLKAKGVKVHLAGHSFGGRLVTAAAMGPDGQPAVGVATLTLLQAAYSHYGLAENYEPNKNGFFRRMVTETGVSGPVLITHTVADKAVGTAYPLASLIAGQDSAALGDKNDRFGGMGRNGAQKTPEASDGKLLADATQYAFTAGKIFNLDADGIITGHSDICHDQVADAMLTAIATT
jgi:pimeloyl-ACP methyl ester carboxylesterase